MPQLSCTFHQHGWLRRVTAALGYIKSLFLLVWGGGVAQLVCSTSTSCCDSLALNLHNLHRYQFAAKARTCHNEQALILVEEVIIAIQE